MSDAHHQPDHDGPHEGPIQTPRQLILAVSFAFVVPIIVIVLLVMYVTSDHRPAAVGGPVRAGIAARPVESRRPDSAPRVVGRPP